MKYVICMITLLFTIAGAASAADAPPGLPPAKVVVEQVLDSVYTVHESKSSLVPVRIVAHLGRMAAVESESLTAGMSVIVDGAARLRPDQPVQVIER